MGMSLATEQRTMTRTGLPAFHPHVSSEDSSAAALNVPSDLARRHRRSGVCRRAFRPAVGREFTAPLPSAVEQRAVADSCGRATCYRHPHGIRAVSARQSAMQARVVHRADRPATVEQLRRRSEAG